MAERTTEEFMFSDEFADAWLQSLKTLPGAALVGTMSIGLVKDPTFVPDPSNTLADYTALAADYHGYAAAATALTVPVNPGPDASGALGLGTFIMTSGSPANPNTVYTYYVYSGSLLIGAEKFTQGREVIFANPGDFLVMSVVLPVRYRQSPAE